MKGSTLMFKTQTVGCLITGLLLSFATSQALASTATSPITAAVIGHAPTLSPGNITYEDKNSNGVLDTGDVVRIDTTHLFTFTDVDGDTATANTYSWTVNNKIVATTETYIIKTTDLGLVIRLEVTPHTNGDITVPADGSKVAAANNLSISASGDVISTVITGNAVVNETLTAKPTCTTACDSKIKYQWLLEDAINSGKFSNIKTATAKTYSPTKDTQKRRIQVIVSNN
ncbi:ZirU family protein [Yersinia sp. 22-579]|uniref:ZirU family protein n=1 Tax=Yersinia sp. 22-579 TaxID=3057580 RepID=UPI00263AB2A6|nr:ZirU family protein [Yersinia sp. 22-579]